VANKPVLFYALESIADAGITDVGIVVGDTAAEIEREVGDGARFGLRVTYIPQEKPLGLAHAVLISRDFLRNSDFVMYLGDNFVVGGISDLVRDFHERRPDAQILLTKVSDPSSFGVAELDRTGSIVRLVEKPARPKSDLALVGVYLFSERIHEAVRRIEPSARGEMEITDALQRLIDDGYEVRYSEVTGYWKDTGNVADMLEVNRQVLESVEPSCEGFVDEASEIVGRVVVAPGAHVENSRIVGPAVIGSGAHITDTYVGPFTSIAEGCRIHESEIEFSIVLADAAIDGVHRIQASLIGRKVRVAAAEHAPKSHRLVLGDHSDVQIHR
jgi:glucose-1-phosphate thymidylyltransferase